MLRILVYVEDDQRFNELSSAVTDSEFVLQRVDDPGRLFVEFDRQTFDGVLLFIEAHRTETEVVCQTLRKHPMGSLVPIVLVTAEERLDDSVMAALGADQQLDDERVCDRIIETFMRLLNIPNAFETVSLGTAAAQSVSEVVLSDKAVRMGTEASDESVQRAELHPDTESGGIGPSGAVPSHPSGAARAPTPWSPGAEAMSRAVSPSVNEIETLEMEVGQAVHMSPVMTVDHDGILEKLRSVRHRDYFAILEVRKGATGREIRAAYARLRQTYDPAGIPAPLRDRYRAELLEICDAIDDAWSVLSDLTLKRRYLKSILILK